jgi:hypothetical protein
VRAKVRLGLDEPHDPQLAADPAGDADVEWRNKQPETVYRRLGRSRLMISEVVSGGDPITPEN